MTPLVAINVLSWNRREDTLACLASLRRLEYPAFRVVVIDNGSTDGSVTAVRAAHPQLEIIENGENLGFAKASNIGIEHARTVGADYVLLLNNDTQVAPDSVQLLVEAAEAEASVAVAGPTIYYGNLPDVIWTAGGAIDWSRGVCTMIGLDETDRGQYGEDPRPVDFVSGCAMLLKLPLLQRTGLIDPRFFAYYEESEWCVRIARAGFKILHVPRARIWHTISPAERAASLAVHYYMTRNRLLFLEATRAGWRAWSYTLFGDYLRTLVSWSVRPKWRSLRAQRNIMVTAILDYFAGRLGPAPVERRYTASGSPEP